MARIENHKYSIEEAFRECFYIVPDYQREYVWTEKEVRQLLEDIGEQIDAGSTREYFIGTVLVSPTDQKNHYEVIDGQQRLTTFFLLLCALRYMFQGEPQRQMISGLVSTSYVDSGGEVRTNLKLEPRYENAGEVMDRLVELDADPQAVRAGIQSAGITSFGSLENLVSAYSTLYHYLKDNYDDISRLKKYWGYLANNVVFIQISTDVSSALKIFETINERGVGLNPMDLLKNLLFTQVEPSEFTKLKDEWKKITKPLEKRKEKPLRFLRYFLMANYIIRNDRNDSVVREDEIYDWFVSKDNTALCNYAGNRVNLHPAVADKVALPQLEQRPAFFCIRVTRQGLPYVALAPADIEFLLQLRPRVAHIAEIGHVVEIPAIRMTGETDFHRVEATGFCGVFRVTEIQGNGRRDKRWRG